ncbi:unnamed protein product [Schistosoma turkestanicum]|nr:unnamed protein product [Schistosoma turkestanicum]
MNPPNVSICLNFLLPSSMLGVQLHPSLEIQIDNNELIISFEVTALFTPIEPSLAKETLSLLFSNDTNLPKYTKLESQSLLELINLCLTTYFQFNKSTNKRKKH